MILNGKAFLLYLMEEYQTRFLEFGWDMLTEQDLRPIACGAERGLFMAFPAEQTDFPQGLINVFGYVDIAFIGADGKIVSTVYADENYSPPYSRKIPPYRYVIVTKTAILPNLSVGQQILPDGKTKLINYIKPELWL